MFLNKTLTDCNSEIQTLLEANRSLKQQFSEFMDEANIKFTTLELQHDQLKETLNLAGIRVETLQRNSSVIEATLNQKVDNIGVQKLNLRYQQLHLVQYENTKTFFIKGINEGGFTSRLLGECKVRTPNCYYMAIRYHKIEVCGFVRLTGVFTIRRPLNIVIRVCFVLKNQRQGTIAFLHNAIINLNLPHKNTVSEPSNNQVIALGIHRTQSLLISKENYASTLVDIPMTDIEADGVLVDGCVMMQVYYTVQNTS